MAPGFFLIFFAAGLAVGLASDQPSAFAAGCGPEVRLDSPGGTMEHVPVVDQGDFGDCYAAVGSYMVDAYRDSHGGNSHFHSAVLEGALGAGLAAKRPIQDALDYGGDECDVAAYDSKTGSCNGDVFAGGSNPLAEDAAFLARSYDVQADEDVSKAETLIKSQSCSPDQSANGTLSAANQNVMALLWTLTKQVESRLPTELEAACKSATREPVRFSKCEQSKGFYLPYSKWKATEAFVLNHLASRTAQPLSIAYCSGLFEHGRDFLGVDPGAKHFLEHIKADCDYHQSILIGKRTGKTGQCQLLIQNTWGADCQGYSQEWDCSGGKIWVDADTLSRNLTEYSFLK